MTSSCSACPVSPPSTVSTCLTSCCPTTFNPGLKLFNRWIIAGDFAVFGLGTRNTGGAISGNPCGLVDITIPDGAIVVAAYLYWNVLCYDSIEADTAYLSIDGTDYNPIPGACIGIGPHTCWSNFGPGNPCNQPTACAGGAGGTDLNMHNRIYWADITSYISGSMPVWLEVPSTCFTRNDPFGNPIPECGDYAAGCRGIFPAFAGSNGMTIVVVWQLAGPPTSCDQIREIIIGHGLKVIGPDEAHGQVSSYGFSFNAQFTGKPEIQYVIGDAQTAWADFGSFNGTPILADIPLQIAPNDPPFGAMFPTGACSATPSPAGVILATPAAQYPQIKALPSNIAVVSSDSDCLAWHVFCYSATNCPCKVHIDLVPDGPGFSVSVISGIESAVALGCQSVDVSVIDNCDALSGISLIVNGGSPQSPPIAVCGGDIVTVQVTPSVSYLICNSVGPNSDCIPLSSGGGGGTGGGVGAG